MFLVAVSLLGGIVPKFAAAVGSRHHGIHHLLVFMNSRQITTTQVGVILIVIVVDALLSAYPFVSGTLV